MADDEPIIIPPTPIPFATANWPARTWTPGERVTAGMMNSVRDELNDLNARTPSDGLRYPQAVQLVDGPTVALDASKGYAFVLIAAGDRTIAVPTNGQAGQRIIIAHYASGGARTLTLSNAAGGFKFGTDFTALTVTASGSWDYITCMCHPYNASRWEVLGVSKGYV